MSIPYQSPEDRERLDQLPKEPELLLNAWNAQNIVYELVINNFLENDPKSLGFNFDQKFSLDRTKSDIFVDISYNWDAKTVNKRPAVFVSRSAVSYKSLTMKGELGAPLVQESEAMNMSMAQMQILVKCIATNVGFTEALAEYVKQPLLFYQRQIQRDFGFRQFRLKSVSEPAIYVEAKEHFVVLLTIDATFDEGWIIKGDDLKLKTVSKTIFDGVTTRPLRDQ